MPAPDGWWSFEVLGTLSVYEPVVPSFSPAFPNPSHGLTCIPLNMPTADQGTLELIDMTGRTVLMIHQGTFAAGVKNYFLNSEGVAPGAYQIVLRTDNYQLSQPLMVR